jgi:hypothetical protein
LSTVSWEKYQKYTVNQIKNAEVCWEPYWHVVVENTLHPELYEQCMANWPEENWLKNTPKLSQCRTVYKLQSGTEFWQDYYRYIMDHTDIQQAVYALLDVPYRKRETMDHLYMDGEGYAVGNHVDSVAIDVAWQLYIYGTTGTNLNTPEGKFKKSIDFGINRSWIIRNDAYSWHSCDTVASKKRLSIMTRYLA